MKTNRSALAVSVFVLIQFLSLEGNAQARGGGPSVQRQLISASVMALTSSTQQGGTGPSGSTVLSQSEYVYAWPNFGVGAFFLYDMQGSTEKDSCFGPKLEAYWDPFFLELGYLVSAKRAYTDRTIAEQTGDGLLYGIGARFKLGAASGGTTGWFFQASYKMRSMKIKKQDGVAIDQPIQQNDGYPLLGIGFQF